MTLAVAACISLVIVFLALAAIRIIRLRTTRNACEGQELSKPSQSKRSLNKYVEAVLGRSRSGAHMKSAQPSVKEQMFETRQPAPPTRAEPAGVPEAVPSGSPAATKAVQEASLDGLSKAVPQRAADKPAADATAKTLENTEKPASPDDNMLGMFTPLGEEDANLSLIVGGLDDVDIRGLVDFAGKVSEELKV